MGTHPLYNQTGLQKDNKSHVMYALANKQMELKQIQDEHETKIAKIKSDLEAMEQVICLFDEDCGSTIEKLNKKTINMTLRNAEKEGLIEVDADRPDTSRMLYWRIKD